MFRDLNEMFNLADDETLAVESSRQNYVSYTLEITIALPQKWKAYENMNLLEKINLYKVLWEKILKDRVVTNQNYFVEYHQNKLPHIHGFIEIQVPPNMVNYEDHMCREFAKIIYMELPRTYWKHFANTKYNNSLSLFKTHAITINIKNILESGWDKYIKKDLKK